MQVRKQGGGCMSEKTLVRPVFTGQELRKLILPLVLEQFLAVTVGMADTMMVSTVGEAAVSGISLVDQANLLLIQVFAAMATGGAVVASQYLGRRDRDGARDSARQLVYVVLALSVTLAVVCVVFNRHLLRLMFGQVEPDVMQAAETYFWLSALSYPFIAVYNAGAALFRSMGNSKVSLLASFIMNVINIGGNALLIYGFQMGVAGAATASLFSRMTACFMVLYLLRSRQNPIYLEQVLHLHLDGGKIRSILKVGIPNGIENGMFQIGKLLVAGLVASFGTASIAANAICNNIGSLVSIPAAAIGLGMVTVVGRCMGADEKKQARTYTRNLLLIAWATIVVMNGLILVLAKPLVGFYAMPASTTDLSLEILREFCLWSIFSWTPSFVLPNALRAAGDAKFTMCVSMVSMWIFRIGMSYVLAYALDMGLRGVWLAMYIDWCVRAVIFLWRAKGDRWQQKKVIE